MSPILSRSGGGGGFSFGFGKKRGGVSSPGFSATGGNLANGLEPGNGYKYHTFGSSGTFTVSGTGTVEVLMVAGGGCGRGGGGAASGGGGAGGLLYIASVPVTSSPGSYSITIGGGSAAKGYNNPIHVGGTPTTAFGYTAIGGGDAGSYPPVYAGQSGGSGGGGGGYPGPGAGGGAGTPGQGNPGGLGGDTGDPGYAGGGGGGAGAAGQPGSIPNPLRSRGGNGLQYPQFVGPLIGIPALNPLSGYFAGGGAGAIRVWPALYVTGGLGGGGDGGTRGATPTGGIPGVQYSGGGGGGDSAFTPEGSSGGSGIVVIRYLA